jgi:alkylation response protein AidB-like acyl-CoA dehydrogenase
MFKLTEEQQLLRDAATAFAQKKVPTSHARAVRDAATGKGFDTGVWNEMANMGWLGAVIPEEHGGVGLGYAGAGLVLEALGRTLAPSPLLSTAVIGASALLAGGSDAQKAEWLPKIAGGEAIVALAVDDGPHHNPAKTKLTAEKSGDGYVLTGRKSYVADGHVADLLIVSATTGEGVTLFLVPSSATGVSVQSLKTIDSRGAADIGFEGVAVTAADVLGAAGQGAALLERILDVARIGLSAEMLGHAAQAFETTLEYLKTRTQFGQLIGSFQSLQHRAAKMFADIEMTRSSVLAALAALDGNANNIPEMASLAKARASDTLHLVSNEMVQMHGGIGMTDAADPGLYIKRARVAEALYGNAAFHRDRYAALLGF